MLTPSQNCQEYLRTLAESITTESLLRLPVSTFITIVGCGDPRLIDMYQRKICAMSRLRDEGRAAIEVERTDHFAAALGAVTTSRGALIALHRERKIHDSVLRIIEGELDLEELRLMRAAEA